jgi:hypothetical protein
MTAGNEIEPRWVRWLFGRPGVWAAGVWGFAEGTLFFVVPDVLFTLTTALRPRRGLLHLVLAVAGAIPAGFLMYSWSAANAVQARSAVTSVPFVEEFQLKETYDRLKSNGAVTMLSDPLGGVPYKVYAVVAPLQLSPREFLLFSIPARAVRMLITWIPAALIGLALRRVEGAKRTGLVLRLHAVAWIAIYAVYWGKLWPWF